MYYANLEDELLLLTQKNEKLFIQNARLQARVETLKAFLCPAALEFVDKLADPMRDEPLDFEKEA